MGDAEYATQATQRRATTAQAANKASSDKTEEEAREVAGFPIYNTMKKTDQFTNKVVIPTKPKTTFATLCIRYEGLGWYLYANDVLWWGPFDNPDQAASWALFPTCA